MKFLKYVGTGILGFLLFLSLSVFGFAFMLNSTVLNPDFVAGKVNEVDAPALVQELIEEESGGQLPSFVEEALYDIITEQEPWLKEQLDTAIHTLYDYLLGKNDRLEISIQLEPLKASLSDSLKQAFHNYIASDITSLPEEMLKPYLDQHYEELIELIEGNQLTPEIVDRLELLFDQYYQEFIGQIPSELEYNESSIPPEVMEQIRDAKHIIGVFQTIYIYLIILMALLVAGIILINRNVRDITRSLGINLLIYGALEFAGVYIARRFMPSLLPVYDLPVSLQPWVEGLYRDLLAPLQTFSLVLLIIGAVLLIVSFVYRRRTEDTTEPAI